MVMSALDRGLRGLGLSLVQVTVFFILDNLLAPCLTPPRSLIGYQCDVRVTCEKLAVNLQSTDILFMGREGRNIMPYHFRALTSQDIIIVDI